MSVTFLDVALGLVFIVLAGIYLRRFSNVAKLPPGPRPLPVIGNAHQMPLEHPEKKFAEWRGIYGDIVFLRLFKSSTLVVNSRQAVRDLMEKRSTNYSGRPKSVWMTDLLDWQPNIGLMQYGETLRKHRRWIQSPLFDKASLQEFLPVQVRETHTLLANLLSDPDKFEAHLHRFAASVVLEIFYGHSVASMDDEYLILIDKGNDGLVSVSAPGAALVDFLPFLRHLPTWFPGAWWKSVAVETRAALKEAAEKTYALAEKTADAKPSVIGSLITQYREDGTLLSQAKEIQLLGSAAYSAGTDTTKNLLHSFFLAMVLHPEVLTKAQEEIDRVIGCDRLPTIEDRELLPYMECVLQELYRWGVPIALGIPHASVEDDEYQGYYIPKGTTVIPNIWLILHDPDDYPDPESFNPSRFWDLEPAEAERIDPRNTVFGFGRRICPGRRLADVSGWLVMANVVAAFDIRKARDAAANEITPPAIWEPGLSSTPAAFRCSIKPRSQQAAELVLNTI